MLRVQIDPDRPDAAALESALRALRAGDVVAYPTDTLYGLAVDPRSHSAVQRLFAIKGRSSEKAVPLVAADHAQIVERWGALAPVADRLARTFWPGPLSLIVPAAAGLASDVHGGAGTVAVRVPDHAVAQMLARLFDHPLTATSANVSGQAPTNDPATVEATLGDVVAVLLDAGPTPGGPPSTLVDVTGPSVRLVREGAVAWERVLRCVGEP